MVSISPERINKKSPYPVFKTRNERTVSFITDFGVHYVASFDVTNLMSCAEIYEFAIINVNNKKSPRDPKLRDTIMAIVLDFFLSSDTAMLYICETGDEKQSMRDRLFRYWAAKYTEYNYFSVYSASVVDEEGIRNYATLILRNDHPKMTEVAAEFASTVQLLNQKPRN